MSVRLHKIFDKNSNSPEIIALVAIALAVLLRIINLGSREFWYDEVLSLLLSSGQKSNYQGPSDLPIVLANYAPLFNLPVETGIGGVLSTLRQLIRGFWGGEPHPPIFFLSQHLWLRLFGNSEAATRSLNALFSVGAIGTTYGLGRTLLGHRGGLLLAALLGVNPFYLFHSLNMRMYAPLVLWGTLSAWMLLLLIFEGKILKDKKPQTWLLCNVVLIGSLAAGLLTFYLFAYWAIALAVLVLYLDRKHWWQHGLRLATAVMLTIPWVLIGTLKQLRNADFKRFGVTPEGGFPLLIHLQDVAQVLGIHLVVGDWVTSLPLMSVIASGCVVFSLLTIFSITLWQQGEKKNLGVALILGIFPLLLALGVDITTKKFTLGFGWGRTMIIIVPGCLLLLALWLEKAAGKWRTPIAAGLLLFYLSVSIGDFSLRQRSVFHSIANLISQEPNTPTLIAMNSQAWGHVTRLGYYISPKASVKLLAQHPANLATTLEKILKDDGKQYPRLLWLDSGDPLWASLKTDAEIEKEKQRVQQVLSSQYQLTQTQHLSGTMSLDRFTVNLYKRSPAT
jgi:uncharacterized membrane protein